MKKTQCVAVLVAALFAGWLGTGGAPAAVEASGKGFVEIPWDRFEVLVQSQGKYKTYRATKGKCALPVGDCELVYFKLEGRSKRGTRWEMRSVFPRRTLKVREGETHKVEVSPPFTARLTVSRHRVRSGQEIKVGLSLVDREGREFNAPSPSSRGEKLRFVVTDAEGNEVARESFEYG